MSDRITKQHIQDVIDVIDSGRIAVARDMLAELVEYEQSSTNDNGDAA